MSKEPEIRDFERQRDELAGAFVKAQFEMHEEKAISAALRAAIINISLAADVLTGTKGAGVRNHIRKLAHDALEASKPIKKCSKCGEKLTGHEDENGTHCRWCVTGGSPTDEPTITARAPTSHSAPT